MDIPLAVLEGLNFFKPDQKKQPVPKASKEPGLGQFNQEKDYCPLGCDPSRTKTAISNNGTHTKGNFVKIYYRGSRIKEEVPFVVKQDLFWRDLNGLVERSTKGKNPSSLRSDRGTSTGYGSFGGTQTYPSRQNPQRP